MSQENSSVLKVYGGPGCPDCTRTKRFLDERMVPYTWFDVATDPVALDFVVRANNGMRIIPTLLFDDGTTMAEPSNTELAKKLGLER